MAQTKDAIALLIADHRSVEALFAACSKERDPDRKAELARQICNELKIHTMIEEELFYPAFRGKIDDDTLDEAYVEHDSAKMLVNDIERSDPSDDFFDAKITVLSEEIKHHVHEEENADDGMFAQCRETDVDLVELGEELAERKAELLAKAERHSLPPAELRVLNVA